MDFDAELDYLKEWIAERVAYLDEQYHYDPTPTGISSADAANDVAVTGGDGYILIRSNENQTLPVYNISGVCVQNVALRTGVNRIAIDIPGVYVVQGHKVIVR